MTLSDVRTGPVEEPRSFVPPQVVVPSQEQSMKSLVGEETPTPPTVMQFFAVEGEPMDPAPWVPSFPTEKVTTMLGLLKRVLSIALESAL